MKKSAMLTLFIALSQLAGFAQSDKTIRIETKNVALVYRAGEDKKVCQLYLGEKLGAGDYDAMTPSKHEAYATFGTNNLFESAIRTVHHDGNPSLDLQFVSQQSNKTSHGSETLIKLKDAVYPFEATLHFKAYFEEDVIEQWAEITHQEKKTLTLYNYASSMLHMDANNYWLTQFHGNWAAEMRMQESQLTSGIKALDSKLGARATMYQSPSFYLSLNGRSDENTGELIAGTLGWSGNFKLTFEIDPKNSLRIISGINPSGSEYLVQPGSLFVTPSFIFTYSKEGKGRASRNLQRYVRKYGMTRGNESRYALLNNWETTYFDFNEESLKNLVGDASKLGLDLFLLDDGWFANKYPRKDDHAGLGDWEENKTKLPHGLNPVIAEGEKKGVKFGIWIEPEMANPKSELYEKHPDWILKLPNRQEDYSRNQLVLDLANPKVQDFVFGVIEKLMTAYPKIAYMKWDCNRMMTNAYSPYLKENQSQLYIDYVRGLYKVFEKVKTKYPALDMMLCSGGGGRVDYQAMKYFTEYWPSDMTDAYERVFIQWGYTFFYPANASCNHVTSAGKQSLKFRTDVAMMGKMGYDIPVGKMTDKELQFSRDAVKLYKQLSETIWFGDLYRLVSPYEEERAVLMYVSKDKSKATLFSYVLNMRYEHPVNRVRLQGLEPTKKYRVKEVNLFPGTTSAFAENGKLLSGEFLMKAGMSVSSHEPLSSAVFEITSE